MFDTCGHMSSYEFSYILRNEQAMSKENVYLVRGKNGEYASGTKICSSGRGAKSTMNKFIEGLIYLRLRELYGDNVPYENPLHQMYMVWCWGGGKQHFTDWNTFQSHNDAEIRNGLNVSRKTKSEYDEFVKIVKEIEDYWHIEEIEQDA